MRLMRVAQRGLPVPCIEDEDSRVYDLSGEVLDWSGSFLDPSFLMNLEIEVARKRPELPRMDVSRCKVLPPFTPSQIFSIGLNYSDHIQEAKMEAPPEPIISSKSHLSIAGAYDDIILPPNSSKVDWEVELGVVIGRRAQYLESVADAWAHIAGYCTANDLSERDWLLNRNGQWIKGKSCESFSPVGPYLVTRGSIDNPDNLQLICSVNGSVQQSSSTVHMLFPASYLVFYISQFMILEPGDLIMTGSPGGMALGRDNPRYLQPGDVVETEVQGLGRQVQVCRNYQRSR